MGKCKLTPRRKIPVWSETEEEISIERTIRKEARILGKHGEPEAKREEIQMSH
jgi:hypothetical protein